MPTPQLLPLTALSHRIYNLILRILHNRLVVAAELQSYSLLLECYHPSAKLTEPPYFCTYHGTDGLTRYEGPSDAEETSVVGKVGELQKMYSRFRPHRRELERGGRRVRPPGDVPGSRTFPIPGTASDQFEGETVKQILSLDDHELFTQLVAQSNLVKIGPRNGLFTCFVEIEEGVVRVWRDWLRDMASNSELKKTGAEKEVVEELGKGKEAAREVEDTKTEMDDSRVLWVSTSKNTGLRFNIRERKLRRDNLILVEVNEDMPVSYEVEYDGRFASHFRASNVD